MMTRRKAFVDTNILLRVMFRRMPLHAEAEALLQSWWNKEAELWISRQVIRECLVQMTHPRTFSSPLTIDDVLHQIATLEMLFRVADDTQDVTTQLLALLRTYPTRGKQIHDANIVATMLVHGLDTLLTLNVADFRRFSDRIILITL